MAQVPASGGELVGSLPGSSSGCHLLLNLNTVKRSVVGQFGSCSGEFTSPSGGHQAASTSNGPAV